MTMGTHLLRARWQDAYSIPTTPFQQSMLAIIGIVAALAFILYVLRMYARAMQKQLGLGELSMDCEPSLP